MGWHHILSRIVHTLAMVMLSRQADWIRHASSWGMYFVLSIIWNT